MSEFRKIVITGPESTGKSKITQELASYFEVQFVVEYAREFITNLKREYIQYDLIDIAKGQLQLQKKAFERDNTLIICDTDLLTIKIWSDYKYKSCDDFIIKSYEQNLPDLYLICYPDLPWEYDIQREHPEKREELFNIYVQEIKKTNIPFEIIKGKGKNRLKNAIDFIESFYINKSTL